MKQESITIISKRMKKKIRIADIFDSIKGEDVTLVLDMGNGLSWKINGQDITEPQETLILA